MADGTDIGSVYQQDALRMCETFVLPNTSWASHHDVDEFLMVDAPGWTSPIPTPRRLSQDASDPSSPSIAWQYPMHLRFSDLLSKATCVPLLRVPFQNYGLRRLSADDSVIARQTVRDHLEPNYHTYGKVCPRFAFADQASVSDRYLADVYSLGRRPRSRRLDGTPYV